ncbi:MAG: T9SS type A sorting domain-containing protein, partial [Candidatus Cloacimonadota bacterium]
GRMYLEGGDVWYWDPMYGGYDFCPLFGINATADGTSDLATVLGQGGTFTTGMSFGYGGENSYIDHISPTGSGFLIFRNSSPVYDCGVANDAGTYQTVGLSFEFGGLVDGSPPSTKEALADSIMRFFGAAVEEKPSSNLKIPKIYGLSQNYPNPANQLSIINYQLPVKSQVSLKVYDVSGRLMDVLIDGIIEPGYHSMRLDTKVYVSGVYFYRLAAGGRIFTKKMVIVR